MMLWALAAWAADAEGDRLVEELAVLARDARWPAIERTYQRLLAVHPSVLDGTVHRVAADAARARGDLLAAAQRLQRVRDGAPGHPEAQAELAQLGEVAGLVRLEGAALSVEAWPFAPDLRAAVEAAVTSTAQQGVFQGLLPAGDYALDGARFRVQPGLARLRVVGPTTAPRGRP